MSIKNDICHFFINFVILNSQSFEIAPRKHANFEIYVFT